MGSQQMIPRHLPSMLLVMPGVSGRDRWLDLVEGGLEFVKSDQNQVFAVQKQHLRGCLQGHSVEAG